MDTTNKSISPFKYPEKNIDGYTFYPSEIIQIDVENSLHLFLCKKREEVKNIIIVGAWRGEEVDSFLQYKNARIFCFEPNPSNFGYLKTKFSHEPRVHCFPFAVGAENKKIDLFESNITGTDSCLPIIDSSQLYTKVKHVVDMRTLDSVTELSNIKIDLIWIDVQGYELEVLKGASQTLSRCSSVFTEVGINSPHYLDAVSYPTITSFLTNQKFLHVAEGVVTQKKDILSGNAYYIKVPIPSLDFLMNFENRILPRLIKETRRRKLLGSKITSTFSKFIPASLKIKIKKLLNL